MFTYSQIVDAIDKYGPIGDDRRSDGRPPDADWLFESVVPSLLVAFWLGCVVFVFLPAILLVWSVQGAFGMR